MAQWSNGQIAKEIRGIRHSGLGHRDSAINVWSFSHFAALRLFLLFHHPNHQRAVVAAIAKPGKVTKILRDRRNN